MSKRMICGLVATLAVSGAIAAAPAAAASIPKGDYVCSTGSGYAGTVNIKRDNKYSVNDGKKGKYSYSRKRKIINFKTGDYKGFFGKYLKQSDGFEVYWNKNGDYLWSCYR
jgi:hypothetical protein